MVKTAVSAPIYKGYLPVARDEFDRLDLASGDAAVWEDLDGHNGSYRNRDTDLRPCLLAARNDWEAVAEFLASVPKSPQTFRSYQKECLRLLLVCRFHFYKPLSSLTLTDVEAYKKLLRHPPKAFVRPRLPKCHPAYAPVTLFVEQRDSDGNPVLDPESDNLKRVFNPQWRPFQKGLSAASATTAMSVVKALMTWLVKTNYLSVSPFSLVAAAPGDTITADRDPRARNALGKQAQRAIFEALEQMPTATERQRLRQLRATFIIGCLLTLGIRMAELTRATMSDVYRERGVWWFRAIGKGNKERQVPAVERFVRAFQDYRISIDLPALPAADEDAMPLIQYVTAENRGAISEYQIRKIVKPILRKAADLLTQRADVVDDSIEQMDLHADTEKLRRATPHWFRHTYATNLHDAEVDPRIIKTCLGHASLDTTMIYSHTEARARHEAIEKALAESEYPLCE